MDALGYGLAWRVLDAQFFGLAQRRERVFLVGRLGERPPVEVLFEPESVPWDPRSSREKRADLAEAAGRRPEGASFTLKLRHTGSDNPGGGAGPLVQRDVSATLATSQDQTLFSFAQNGNGLGAGESEAMPALDTFSGKAVCIADDNANAAVDVDLAGTIKVGGSAPMVSSCRSGGAVRRLTPTECERLQGFPDGWTRIPYRGKPAEECPDGPRYKAIGNSMAVPVMRWIGERIGKAERGGLE